MAGMQLGRAMSGVVRKGEGQGCVAELRCFVESLTCYCATYVLTALKTSLKEMQGECRMLHMETISGIGYSLIIDGWRDQDRSRIIS